MSTMTEVERKLRDMVKGVSLEDVELYIPVEIEDLWDSLSEEGRLIVLFMALSADRMLEGLAMCRSGNNL
ncbi:MAG: hypothetical protein O3B73_10140 [bacterium]|nr:hypothetical protein [bacterium]